MIFAGVPAYADCQDGNYGSDGECKEQSRNRSTRLAHHLSRFLLQFFERICI
jgi:hypothetical protein